MVTPPGQCCGECVQTKCKSNGRIHKVGDMWKSDDNCTFFECVLRPEGVRVSSYKKSCPPVTAGCPRHKIMVRECCSYCEQDEATDRADDGNNGRNGTKN